MDRALLSFFPFLPVSFSRNSFDQRALLRDRNHRRNDKPVEIVRSIPSSDNIVRYYGTLLLLTNVVQSFAHV